LHVLPEHVARCTQGGPSVANYHTQLLVAKDSGCFGCGIVEEGIRHGQILEEPIQHRLLPETRVAVGQFQVDHRHSHNWPRILGCVVLGAAVAGDEHTLEEDNGLDLVVGSYSSLVEHNSLAKRASPG
jgi:hypothetical protein